MSDHIKAYFLDRADSKHFGFQFTAIAFSLPRVFTLWALIVSSLQPLVIALGLPLAGICVAAVVMLRLVAALCLKILPRLRPSILYRHLMTVGLWFRRTPVDKSDA